MAVPARKTSKSKKAKRRTHHKMTITGLNECPNCGEMKKSHHVCANCGYYDGKDVTAKEEA
ncbi:50S ribosomal protein L32 [Tetragenococcus halophilus]|uniref:Large ribosomal subunit protein bL32 n=3 Tax=Tetragenococcus halophilus TaxID=51669 RepID=A0A2H6CRQ1_TETHA|nr:50S ribosomal protein L32 [Tetragenococcus halophilus]AOF49327.1 50S ribosomal protein L32 [Tetragenococcus halophilus]AYW51043.1 50S ribosomal protein L32 [Tetragenococcus halophilus]MCF1602413.1 50S ribosomal protein L32 [Tetragenococcus halophilus]MCF1675934.1 50S ribosomal protein L32 [Tetragenococcus halophilus]MCO7027306.1 50S ribosomal protein L32 [Tetragenococcus halophilus]